MRVITLFALLIFISMASFGQTVNISGTVTDQKGQPVPFAFIRDSQHSYAAYADSAGNFNIKTDAVSGIIVTANHFKKTSAKIDAPGEVKIIMIDDPSNDNPTVSPSLKDVFRQKEDFESTTEASLTLIGTHQEGLHGNKYLFDNWVHGFVLTPKDSIKQNDGYLFNYDKINGNFVFATGGTKLSFGVRSEIKDFLLFDNSGKRYVFEEVPAINNKRYMQVLAAGPKYKIYKDFATKFVKADYVDNGISHHGNNYDEFVDEIVYYLVKPGGQPEKLSLRKKAIKTAFASDADKVNRFLTDNDSDIDDAYLQKLGEYMNQ